MPRRTERRSPALLRQHYEVEKELADRLRHATREQRRSLYGQVYDELYQRVPQHPQLTRKVSPELSRAGLVPQLRLLRRYLRPETVLLEIGPGDCALSITLAEQVRQVYGLDVSETFRFLPTSS
jgi:2-polyprenyl-3-methyl-5-hydroxy-6-metoxy-1,4-benzoquinol methylase